MRHVLGKESLAEEIAGIPSLPGKALVARWAKAYGRPPPRQPIGQQTPGSAANLESERAGPATTTTIVPARPVL